MARSSPTRPFADPAETRPHSRSRNALIESDGAAVASFATRPGLALIGGGMPVVVGGQVAGAIGVAGAMTAAEDRRIAEAAVSGAGGKQAG
jgi:uncharacterized protein GlcG (DUF336 family)